MTEREPNFEEQLEGIVAAIGNTELPYRSQCARNIVRFSLRAMMRFHTRDEARALIQEELLDLGIAPRPAPIPPPPSTRLTTGEIIVLACLATLGFLFWSGVLYAAAALYRLVAGAFQ